MRGSKRHYAGLSAVTALAVALGGATPSAIQAQSRPRLAVKLINEDAFDGLNREQAVAINTELGKLKQNLPGLEVIADRFPSGRFDYSLSDLVMVSSREQVTLTVRYQGPEGFADAPTGRFEEACSQERERKGECSIEPPEARARLVVADLFDRSLVHWRHGIYRPFGVLDCKRVAQSIRQQGVRLLLQPPDLVDSYREPSTWFEYRPSVLKEVESFRYPESLELVLRRQTKDGDAFIFERRDGPAETLDRICPTKGWILVHQYPGHQQRPGPLPVGINATPDPSGR